MARALYAGAPALRRLALHENNIGERGMCELARAMHPAGASRLEVLRLAFNRIGNQGIKALALAWRQGGGAEICELHAASNEIGCAGIAALASELRAAPRLRLLSMGSALGGNRVSEPGALALAEALRGLVRESSWRNRLRELVVSLKLNPLGERALA